MVVYNSRQIYLSEEEKRAYWQDFIAHLKELTGKRLTGRLGGGGLHGADRRSDGRGRLSLPHVLDHRQPALADLMSVAARNSASSPTPARPIRPACAAGAIGDPGLHVVVVVGEIIFRDLVGRRGPGAVMPKDVVSASSRCFAEFGRLMLCGCSARHMTRPFLGAPGPSATLPLRR